MPKRHLFPIAIFLFSLLTQFGCKTDFDVNAPYKEEYVIYGLLEQHAGTQVIKISKLYQNGPNSTAYQGARQIDSLYQSQDLTVQLWQITNGTATNPVALSKYFDNHKDSGVFAYPGQYLFSTPAGFTLNPDVSYKITIDNTKTGVHCEANTIIVGDMTSIRPSGVSQIVLTDNLTGYYPISIQTGKNAATYDLDIMIPVNTYRKSDSSLVKSDTLDWNIFKNYTQVQNGKIIYNILGHDFYSFIGASFTADKNVYRRMGKLDFHYVGAAQDLANYIQVNTPSLGIVQKKPNYTNVTGGLGIFSSRQIADVYAALTDGSYDLLRTSPETSTLNFVK